LLLGCRSPRAAAGSGSYPDGLEAAIAPETVDPAYQDAWRAVVEAEKTDPSGAAVVEAADALIAEAPPADLHVAASLAKARAAHLRGDDRGVVSALDAAAAAHDLSTVLPELALSLRKSRAFALARGGDAKRALAELDILDGRGEVSTVDLRGARAAAWDRLGSPGDALLAYVAWRELLADDAPEAGYAQMRIVALGRGLDRAALERLAARAPGPDAKSCLLIRAGAHTSEVDQAPAWARSCADVPSTVGVLLPRSGRLAALADEQLAAAVVAVDLLSAQRRIEVVWADTASTSAGAKAGAERLATAGVERIVGPLAPGNIDAAQSVRIPFVVPGEASGRGEGVAPSLELRVESLVSGVAREGRQRLYVLAPTNAYGDRGVAAVEAMSDRVRPKHLKIIRYDARETSFAKSLEGVRGQLGDGVAVLVVDALPRVELVARQLQRWQVALATGSAAGLRLASTGEGYGHRTVGRGHEPLDGVWIAPVAHARAEDAEFTRQFERQQGHPPSDQALLVWRAFERVWRGGHDAARPAVLAIDGGRLVAVTPR